ncbi:MAG: hypothetical protein KME35_07665 [Aphanocapsa sp. GSE-SYN-MK-11-07L]|nr:hypothetical protein [Aphanocapsa sp. GSE-SYN-MK-11-07L]
MKQEQWPQAEGKPDLNPDFKRWLISRAERLGKSDPLSWALTVIKNPDPILVAEFHQYQQPQPTQIQDSACLHEEAEAENPILAAFNRLKAKWNCPYPPLQKKFRAEVSREIEAHPEWGIWISPDLELFLADQALSVQTESSRSEMWNSSESECHELEADCLAAVSEHNHRTWQESRVLKTPLVHSQIRAEQSDFLPEAPPEDLMDLIVEIQTRFKLLLGWSDDRFQTWLQEGFGHSRLEVLTDAELHQVKERLERTSNQSNRNLPLNQRSVNEEKLNLANDLYSMP